MKKPRIHLEIQNHRSSPIGVLRTTFRDPVSGKISHTQHGRITGVPLQTLLNVQAALKDEVIRCDDPDAFKVVKSRELGASAALLELAKDIGLSTCLYSRPQEQWVQDALAMIVGRITYQGSKLALSQTANISALWELCGVQGKVDVDEHCYEVMDRLLERQAGIQKHLAAKHLSDGCIVLYDITSSYLEGEYEESEIVQFGYNRDGKRGHEQIVIGLLTDAKGCPFAMEVFPGNTQDASTVTAKIKELRNTYGFKEIVFVGDRGMITKSNEAKLAELPEAEEFKIISALTHRQIVALLAKNELEPSVFDDRNIVEIIDTEDHNRRYCLCRNPHVAEKSGATRRSLLERTKQGLTRIAERKTKGEAAKLGAQVGKLLAKTKMGKFINWAVNEGRLEWSVKEEEVTAEAAMDGCYVIKATVPTEDMDKETVVSTYKSLQQVERAFRSMKTVKIELRPIYHRKDERIKAHAFLCMLAYYLLWHMKARLEPLFAKQEEEIISGQRQRKDRTWTIDNVLENLKMRRRNLITCQGQEFSKDMEPDAVQAEILRLLKTPPPPTVVKGDAEAA
jgi:transposase